jgi:hypothetical protein
VPLALARRVENSPTPSGRKGPAAPRVQKGPAYKETYKNGATEPLGLPQAEGQIGLAAKHDRRSTAGDDARLDAGIVELFADKAKGWEFLTVLPDDALAQLRDLQRRSKLDRAALIGPWNRYGHLLRGRQEGGTGG